jgi:hypothetical protein
VVGTINEEFVISSSDNKALSNTNITILNQTAYGSKRIRPIVIDKSVLFVDGTVFPVYSPIDFPFLKSSIQFLPALLTLRNKTSLDFLPGITQNESIFAPILCL